jgi:hypothetical protein
MNGIVLGYPDREIHVILDNLKVYNPKAAPFEWTKAVVPQVGLKKRYAD